MERQTKTGRETSRIRAGTYMSSDMGNIVTKVIANSKFEFWTY